MSEVEAHVDEAVSRLLAFIESMKDDDGLEIAEADNARFDLVMLNRKAIEHAGRVIAPASRGKRYRHRGVGARDWLHFWLAPCAGADMICATDAAFADIAGSDDAFGHILVQLTAGPLAGPLAVGGAAA